MGFFSSVTKAFKSVGKAISTGVKSVVKTVGKAVQKVASSKVGQIAALAATIYTGGTAAGWWGAAEAGAAPGLTLAEGASLSASGEVATGFSGSLGSGLTLGAGQGVSTSGLLSAASVPVVEGAGLTLGSGVGVLQAGSTGLYSLTANEVAQGYKLVSTASNLVQKVTATGRLIEQSAQAMPNANAIYPIYSGAYAPTQSAVASVPLNLAQGVTGAEVNAAAAAERAAATQGQTVINNQTIMAVGAALGLFYFLGA